MQLVHLTASRFFGGPERQMLGLAQSLPPEHHTAFVSFAETGLCRAFLEEVRRAGFEGIALQHDTPHLLAALKELTSLLRRLNADLLCCHGYKAGLLGLLAARRIGIPIVAVSRGWTAESFRVRLYEKLDRFLLGRLDKVVCVSEAQAQKVRRAGVLKERIAVIHNAIRPERFAHPDPAYRERLCRMFPEAPNLIVGAAGRLSPEKGFDVLVDAAAIVSGTAQRTPHTPCADSLRTPSVAPQRTPHTPCADAQSALQTPCAETQPPCAERTVGFVLFGDGPLWAALAERIAARGLEGRFILAGFHADLDHWLPHLDLFVQSSYTEGLPNVILEAFAAGVPVVATAVGGTPEVVEDGLSGYLVGPGNAGSLDRRITDMLSNDAQRRAMGLRGQQKVAQHFSFSSQACEYKTLLDSLLSSKGRFRE